MTPPRRTTLVLLLASLAAAGPLASDMYVPSLQEVADGYGATAAAVQPTLSVFLACFALARLSHFEGVGGVACGRG